MRDKVFRATWFKCLLIIGFLAFSSYGAIRLYFQVTDGFSIANISSDFAYQPDWEVRPLSTLEKVEVDQALNQEYRYLGKGCQSYVFLSSDGHYVVKFFKYQRFRLQPWIAFLPGFDFVENYRQAKLKKKWEKLNVFVTSWKIAYDHLKTEAGLLWVHLNKTEDLHKRLVIYDKMGFKHILELDQMEFCLQRRAEPLNSVLVAYKAEGQLAQAQQLMSNLLQLMLSEYQRGLSDNDHALLQNTGVVNHHPIHIDVGQFLQNEKFKDPAFYRQDLFTRTYRLHEWLKQNYPELGAYLWVQLREVIGPEVETMQPRFHSHWALPGV